MDRLKRNIEHLLIQLVIFVALYFVFSKLLNMIYIFGWLSHINNIWIYFGIMVIALLFTYFDMKYIGYGITFGHLIGSFIGYFAGTIMQKINMAKILETTDPQTIARLNTNHGVPIWLVCILLGALFGWLHGIRKNRKARKLEAKKLKESEKHA